MVYSRKLLHPDLVTNSMITATQHDGTCVPGVASYRNEYHPGITIADRRVGNLHRLSKAHPILINNQLAIASKTATRAKKNAIAYAVLGC